MHAGGSPANRSDSPIAPQRLGESVKQLADGGAQPDEKQAMTEAGRELDRQNLAGQMRESAQAMRQGQQGEQQQAGAAGEIARALDKVADQLGAAGERDAEASRLSDQLSRAQELRDRLGRLQRTMEELKEQGAQGAQSAQPGC